jgi:putative oxidoreductase
VRDVGLLLLRIVAGATLAAHGYPKLFGGPGKRPHPLLARTIGPNYPTAVERGGPGFATALETRGVPYPQHAAKVSGLTEFAGGMALATGFLTRPAGLAAAFNMGVASWTHWKNGFYGQGGYEFPLLLGTAALTIALTGPGAISVDAILLS